MQISRVKNLQYFILFSNVFRTFYSGSLQHLSNQLCKQGQNLLENIDETTKTAGHYILILLGNNCNFVLLAKAYESVDVTTKLRRPKSIVAEVKILCCSCKFW